MNCDLCGKGFEPKECFCPDCQKDCDDYGKSMIEEAELGLIQQAKQEEAKEIFDELDKEHEKSVGIPYEIYLEIKKKRLSTINVNRSDAD